jgi:hypothetical protein
MTRKLHSIAVFIEFIAGSGLALFFHWVLHYQEAAYIIFGVGILLSLATYLLKEEIESSREQLLDQYRHAHETTFAISEIADPECQAKAGEVMAGAMNTIQLLQQGYIPLEEAEFYLEGARQLDQAAGRVKAVDPFTGGWDSRGPLLNFYQANLRALERGVRITRIFVLNRDSLDDPAARKVILPQIRDGIDVRIAFREELPAVSDISGRNTNSSFDFAIYDDRVVTDGFNQPGKYFGRKTAQRGEIYKYLEFYTLIEHASHAVIAEGDSVELAL